MKTPLVCLMVGLLVGATSRSGAQALEAAFLGYGPSLATQGVVDGDFAVGGPAGELLFDGFSGFSVDPFQALQLSEAVVFTIQDAATLAEIGAVQRIVGGYGASGRTGLDAAGAQWAIWEAVFDGTTDPTFLTGSVRLQDPDSAVAQRALDYLANLAGLPEARVLYLTSPTRQDLIAAVPEPAAVVLAAGALGWLGLRRRR